MIDMTPVLYRHAPLVLTVLELTHPEHPLAASESQQIKAALQGSLPLLSNEQQVEMRVELPSGVQQTSTIEWTRFRSRDRRTMLSCSATKTTLETTAYQGWEAFRGLFDACLRARLDTSGLDSVERIGLRYIDEVRVASKDWRRWIEPALLPPQPESLDGLQAELQQSTVQYGTSDPAIMVTMRYGLVDGPPAVSHPLRTDQPANGKYFLFDTDAAWTLPDDAPADEVDPDRISELAHSLHDRSKALFEWWPTPALRDEVFNAD